MNIDHAMRRFYSIVRQTVADVPSIQVAWSRFQGQMTFPWVSLQVIIGPNTERQQRSQASRVSVAVKVLAGSVGDPVAVMIGGRYVTATHTGDPETTIALLAAQAPAHWTVGTAAADTLAITGPDVFGAVAYFATEVTNTPVGELIWVNQHRRDCTIQVDVWTQLDKNGRPARWDPTGCDTLALRIRDALWDIVPDPFAIYIRPSDVLRPFSESFPDGREYLRSSFDTVVSWLDIVAERQYGAEVSTVEETTGTIESTSDGLSYVIETFEIDESLDP